MDLFSVINIIVLLNLLISLIGDIYDKVQENQMPNDALERLDMMRELEYMMFWNRNRKEYKHVHLIISSDKIQ